MTKFTLAAITAASLCGAGIIAEPCAAMPMSNLATMSSDIPPNVRTVADDCGRSRCWWWPSYYDTPAHLRPRVFYGYEPHRHGDWFEYLYGRDRFGYRKDPARWK